MNILEIPPPQSVTDCNECESVDLIEENVKCLCSGWLCFISFDLDLIVGGRHHHHNRERVHDDVASLVAAAADTQIPTRLDISRMCNNEQLMLMNLN